MLNNHGDLILKPVKGIKRPISIKPAKLHILQDSGPTGNRHEVIGDAVYRWTKDAREFLYSKTDYEIRHVGGDEEHGVQKVEKGTREVLHEVEYDPWKNELKIVVD